MSIKRLHKELRDLNKDPIPNCIVKPFEEDILQWRFVFKGEDDSEYKGGLYMGSVVLPKTYPFAPPRISMITPNGRFRIDGRSICLSISDWHPESWNPAWGVRAIVIGLISFFYDTRNTNGAVHNISIEQKKKLAIESIPFNQSNKDYQTLFTNNVLERSIVPRKVVIIKRKKVKN